jgi:hypothetical protein
VNLFRKVVERAYPAAVFQQLVAEVRADEAGAACNQYVFPHPHSSPNASAPRPRAAPEGTYLLMTAGKTPENQSFGVPLVTGAASALSEIPRMNRCGETATRAAGLIPYIGGAPQKKEGRR